jgi:hypothetical protein
MSKTIVLTNLVISSITIDYERQMAAVNYKMITDNGIQYEKGTGYFWVVIPDPGLDPDGNPLPIPDNWFQLPSSYFPTLLQLKNDADIVLTNKFLI